MMIVYMANGNESYYLQLGRRNAASTMLTKLQPSSPVAALPSPECRAYVERISDWPPFARVPCWPSVVAQILSVPVVAQIATYAR